MGLAVAADGKSLASGAFHGVARLWDLDSGKEFRQFTAPQNASFLSLALSPDGKLLAADKYVWDTASGKERYRFPFPVMGLMNLHAFTPDGRALAVASREVIQLYEPLTGKLLRQLPGHHQQVVSFSISADGKHLVSGDVDGTVRVWDLATGRERRRFKGPENGVYGVSLSPDGKAVAFVSGNAAKKTADHLVSLWEVATGQERRRFSGHRSYLYTVAFSPNGKWLVSPSYDNTALVWDVTGSHGKENVPATQPTREQTEAWRTALGAADAGKAYQAMCALAAQPGAVVPLLKGWLQPAATADLPEVPRLIADLDSDRFSVRQRAEQALAELGEKAEGALRRALAKDPPLHVRKCLDTLLEKLDGPVKDPERLCALRAVEVLENVGTPQARNMLESLAAGAPEARLTREAKTSLERLAKQPAASP
jgi:hypothetical protein